MKTNINCNPDYQNLEVLHKNTLKSRSYFIPSENKKAAKTNKNFRGRENDSKFLLLSGEWNFAYFTAPSLVPNDAITKESSVKFDKIKVPSCWQSIGYEKPFYVNNDFTCPAIPPLVPNDNPVGLYNKEINVDKEMLKKEVVINFLGVCSAFTLFINGLEVGYSQGSHNMSQFNITKYLVDGKNLISVLVYKWSDGSYLESQDMFRYNGIFRDVYLTFNEESSIFDFTFKTNLEKGEWNCSLNIEIDEPNGCKVLAEIESDSGEVVYSKKFDAENEIKTNFTLKDVLTWTAETPNLYHLYLTLIKKDKETECVYHSIGFKSIDYSGPTFKVNGVPIKIKGVNHHDSMPKTGFVMTQEEYEQDIRLMKEANVNTVRTSHYPPDPIFIDLCNIHGLYVIDEADLESYGSINMKDALDYFGSSPDFEKAFLDRMEKLYFRDKNNVSIIMLSLGNEAGIGVNFEKSYDYLKTKTELPIQYETCFREYFYKEKGFDIVSLMYPEMELIDDWMSRDDNRPFYLCEYAHCMGVGPGGFKEYWEKIYQYEKFIGGCVWEWCDHAPYKFSDKYEYTYGGDHGEYVHDGNFCCDGLVYPDRRPSTSYFEMKNVYSPIISKVVNVQENFAEVEIFNTQNFVNSSNLKITYSLLKSGKKVGEGVMRDIILPYTKIISKIPLPKLSESDYQITLEYRDSKTGFLRGFNQSEIKTVKPTFKECKQKVEFNEDDNKLTVLNANGSITFDKNKCTVSSYVINGKEMISRQPKARGYNCFSAPTVGFYPNIWKVPTDNDLRFKDNWYKHMYNLMFISFYNLEVVKNSNFIEFTATGYLSPPKYSKKFSIKTNYKLYSDLTFDVEYSLLALEKDLPFLPKFGANFEMPREFEKVEWYGLGDKENYPDFKECAVLGVYNKLIEDLREPYIKAQESGERCEVRYLKITDSFGDGIKIAALDSPISFNAQHFTIQELEKATHKEDIVDMNTTLVCVDGLVSGLGSNSCGPLPFEKYRINADTEKELKFRFKVLPV